LLQAIMYLHKFDSRKNINHQPAELESGLLFSF